MLRVGEWRVNPAVGEISRNGEVFRVEERTFRLLLCLAARPGEVVSIDELLEHVWPGVTVTPDSVYQAVASLRRQLGDDPKQPTYIATVPRLGYRLVAPVDPLFDGGAEASDLAAAAKPTTETAARRRRPGAWLVVAMVGAAMCLVVAIASRSGGTIASDHRSPAAGATSEKSIAVLPFLDLTEGMKNEEFADGMTEELIDRLSKIPTLRVPPPTSSFYFKGKQMPVAEIAKKLGVAYVLDGSVRKSGVWLRVDARLIRADSGFVIWSETYDRPLTNILTVQDDIAAKATKALEASLGRCNR